MTTPLELSRGAPRIAFPLHAVTAALAFVVGNFVFLHPSILSAGRLLPADELDGRLVLHIQEHWWRVISGLIGWRDLGMFFPTPDTLGLSDGMLGFGLTHAVLRSAGFGVYQAFLPNLLLWAALGFWGMHRLLRRELGVRPWLASATAGLFLCFSPVTIGPFLAHPQILTVWMVPWSVLAFLWWARHVAEGPRRSAVPAAAVAASCAVILLTAFQTGWFVVFSGGLVTVAGLSLVRSRRREHHEAAVSAPDLLRRAASVVVLAALIGVALVPFLRLYLPEHRIFGDHPYTAVRELLPVPCDLLNPSPWNAAWGWLPRLLLGNAAGRDEHYFGLPVISLLLFLVAAAGLWRRRRELPWLAAPAAVVLIGWGLMIRVGDFSLWQGVRALLPGAGAVRAVFRFNAVLAVPVLVTIAVWAELCLRRRPRPRGLAVACTVLVPLLFAEQWMVYPAWKASRFDRTVIEARLAAIPPPPVGTVCFYVVPYETGGFEPGLRSQLDAWAVAQRDGVPTLNGFSGLIPSEFSLFAGTTRRSEQDYRRAVGDWVSRCHLEGAAAELDLNTATWRRHPTLVLPVEPSYRLDTVLDGGASAADSENALGRYSGGGWSSPEPAGTWTDRTTAFLEMTLDDLPPRADLTLELKVASFRCRHAPVPRVQVFANGAWLGEASLPDAPVGGGLFFTIPRSIIHANRTLELRFELPDARRPVDCVKRNPDRRLLGMFVRRVVLRPAP